MSFSTQCSELVSRLTTESVTRLYVERDMPGLLSEIYSKAYYPRFYSKVDRLLPPESIFTSGDHSIFSEENQNVVVWAYKNSDSSDDDPMVFQGQPMQDKLFAWYEEKTFSDFFIDWILWNGAQGAAEKIERTLANEDALNAFAELPIFRKTEDFIVRCDKEDFVMFYDNALFRFGLI